MLGGKSSHHGSVHLSTERDIEGHALYREWRFLGILITQALSQDQSIHHQYPDHSPSPTRMDERGPGDALPSPESTDSPVYTWCSPRPSSQTPRSAMIRTPVSRDSCFFLVLDKSYRFMNFGSLGWEFELLDFLFYWWYKSYGTGV